MPGYIKVWVKMLIDFIFSVAVIGAIISYALLGTLDPKGVTLKLLEYTGQSGEGQLLVEGVIPIYLVSNLLWFSLFVFGFCLILLFFIEPKLKVFLFPGTLCFLSVFFIQVAMFIINSFISPETPEITVKFASLFFEQINRASLVTGITGMILLILSCFNLYQIQKNTGKKES